MEGCYPLDLGMRVRGVKYITVLMLVVAILFLIPALLYMFEGGFGIAILPTILMIAAIIITIGLYFQKKYAWFAALFVGLIGCIIFIADCFNKNIESYLGAIFCIILLIGLVFVRKHYFNI